MIEWCAKTEMERISQINSQRAAVGARRQLKGEGSMAPESVVRYVGQFAGTALSEYRTFQSP